MYKLFDFKDQMSYYEILCRFNEESRIAAYKRKALETRHFLSDLVDGADFLSHNKARIRLLTKIIE